MADLSNKGSPPPTPPLGSGSTRSGSAKPPLSSVKQLETQGANRARHDPGDRHLARRAFDDPALLQLVVEMNLFGTVYSCNAVAPVMKRQRSGKIITVSSVAGTGPSIDGGYAHYGAARAAIAHYTRYLAQDLGPFGITANCIAPGVIATGRIMSTVIPGSSQSNRDRAELVALRRLGTVEDCAKVVEFLATDLSDYVTGA